MRGAWLDDDEPTGRYAHRHDGGYMPKGYEERRRSRQFRPPSMPQTPRGAFNRYDAPEGSLDGRDYREHLMHPPAVDADEPAAGAAAYAPTGEGPEVPPPGWTGVFGAIGGLTALGVIVAGAIGNSETRAAALTMIVVGAIMMPVLRRLAGGRRDTYQILLSGFAFKVTATVLRYYLASGGYYKNSDAYGYDQYGRQIADEFLRHGHMPNWKSYTGTAFIRLLTGFVYTVTPASELSAFFVFATFSFIGTLLFWRAVRMFAPPPTDRNYLLLVLFVPSFVYWPSSLGKEAVVIFGLGLTTFGFACILKNKLLRGITCTFGGVWVVTMVRPHVGVAVMLALTVATLLAKQTGRRTGLIAMGVILLFLSGFVIARANAFFQSDITSAANISDQLSAAGERTSQGGSEFEPTTVSPQNFPMAVVTVLIRPFPWEAGKGPELVTAIESMVIGYLIIKNFKDIRKRVRRNSPLGLYALVAVLVFVVLFWNFANFGILARQRTQIAPFLFILLALPVVQFDAITAERRARRSGKKLWDEWDAAHGT